MNDIEKLRHLLEHWAEHNDEHAKTYLEWADKAKASGNKELQKILKDIAVSTKKMNGMFGKAIKIVNK